MEKKNEEYTFYAALHGIDLSKENSKQSSKQQSRASNKSSNNNALPMFGAPEDYEHLSEEERKELTMKMMGKHRSWVDKSTPKSVKTK